MPGGWTPRSRSSSQINAHAARTHQGILASPNCTTIVTVMPLKPLHDAGRLRRVMRPRTRRSPAPGVNGIEDLRAQTLAWARGETAAPKHFPHPIAFDLIPAIDKFADDGYTGEELKLVHETRKILETPDLLVAPTTVRVPVFTATRSRSTPRPREGDGAGGARAVRALPRAPAVGRARRAQRYPMPIDVEGQDDCVVGRVREDLSHRSALNFWVVGDQLRKGAATNAVQIAELVLR